MAQLSQPSDSRQTHVRASLAIDGTLLGGIQLPRRRGPWPAGRAYLVRRGAVELVQVACD